MTNDGIDVPCDRRQTCCDPTPHQSNKAFCRLQASRARIGTISAMDRRNSPSGSSVSVTTATLSSSSRPRLAAADAYPPNTSLVLLQCRHGGGGGLPLHRHACALPRSPLSSRSRTPSARTPRSSSRSCRRRTSTLGAPSASWEAGTADVVLFPSNDAGFAATMILDDFVSGFVAAEERLPAATHTDLEPPKPHMNPPPSFLFFFVFTAGRGRLPAAPASRRVVAFILGLSAQPICLAIASYKVELGLKKSRVKQAQPHGSRLPNFAFALLLQFNID